MAKLYALQKMLKLGAAGGLNSFKDAAGKEHGIGIIEFHVQEESL